MYQLQFIDAGTGAVVTVQHVLTDDAGVAQAVAEDLLDRVRLHVPRAAMGEVRPVRHLSAVSADAAAPRRRRLRASRAA